jgi:hypothetical protein
MEEKLIAHEVIHSPKNGDVLIKFTDVQFHTNKKETVSIQPKIEKSYKKQKESRIVFNRDKIIFGKDNNGNEIIFMPSINVDDPGFMSFVKERQKEGKRVFIQKPKDIKAKLGNDTVEFMNSKKGKRILRKMKKDK